MVLETVAEARKSVNYFDNNLQCTMNYNNSNNNNVCRLELILRKQWIENCSLTGEMTKERYWRIGIVSKRIVCLVQNWYAGDDDL
jgi:hypothetical protein